MRNRALSLIGVFLLLLAAAPIRAQAQDIGIVGIVTRIDVAQEIFWLQESGSTGPGAGGRTWIIRVTPGTEGLRDRDLPIRETLRGLRVGDVVEVRGTFVGNNQILARTLILRSDIGRFQGPAVSLRGTILDIDFTGRGFLQVQEVVNGRASRVWTVRVFQQTRVEAQARFTREGDDVALGEEGLRRLRRGDFIEVQGSLIGNVQILASEITLIRRGGFAAQPVPTFPYGWQTVILSPQEGTRVPASEFTVVGHTMPGAQVQVQVMARWAFFNVEVANMTVSADRSGTFVAVVRPSSRLPGATYTITATSSFQGLTAAPVSVTVGQL